MGSALLLIVLLATPFGIPADVGDATQVITVVGASRTATSGTLTAWQRAKDGTWKVAHGPFPAWLGEEGIGEASESHARTPEGTYTLTEAFGRKPNPGTRLPYFVTDAKDWWVSDVRSPKYNTHQRCAKDACDFSTAKSEHLVSAAPYDYAVVVDVNRSPAVPGGGSAFFLHLTENKPTAGCVGIDRAALVAVMKWLDPKAHPRFVVGVN